VTLTETRALAVRWGDGDGGRDNTGSDGGGVVELLAIPRSQGRPAGEDVPRSR
jgi:hypothetical protein